MEADRLTEQDVIDMIRRAEEYSDTLDLSHRVLDGHSYREVDFGHINLSDASLQETILIDCNLTRANLRGADLTGANLTRANMKGVPLQNAVLFEADLPQACLEGAHLQGADLRKADLRQADLTEADLEGAKLQGAKLENANLTRAKLWGADLSGSVLDSVMLSHTILERDSLGPRLVQEEHKDYLKARYVYLALKNNFQQIGDYDAASWAYVRERTMERMTYRPRSRKWLGSWLMGFFTGYGEEPLHAMRLVLASVVGFAVLYRLFGGIEANPPRLLTFWDYLLYSFGAVSTMPPEGLEATTALAKILTSAEGISGVAALAVFTTAMTQRIGR